MVCRRVVVALALMLPSCSVMEVAHDIPCIIGGEQRVVRAWIDVNGPGSAMYGVMFDSYLPLDVLISPLVSVVGLFDSRVRTKGSWLLGPIPHVAAMILPGLTSTYEVLDLSELHLQLPAEATLEDVREALLEHWLPTHFERAGEGQPLLEPPPSPYFWGQIGEITWLHEGRATGSAGSVNAPQEH